MKFRSSVVFFLFTTIFSFTFFACKDSQKELKIYSIIHDEETKILCEEFTKKQAFQFHILELQLVKS